MWNQGDQVNAATVGTKGMNNLESQYNQILTDLAAGIATAIGTTGIGTFGQLNIGSNEILTPNGIIIPSGMYIKLLTSSGWNLIGSNGSIDLPSGATLEYNSNLVLDSSGYNANQKNLGATMHLTSNFTMGASGSEGERFGP